MLQNFKTVSQFLEEELLRRTRSNSQYSLRSFARDLNMSPGELSEIIRAKRKLSLKNVYKISTVLGLNKDEVNQLKQLSVMMEDDSDLNPVIREKALSEDMFRIVSDWYCFAILNLADTKGFSWDPNSIAKRLGIKPIEAKDGLNRLEKVGLIQKTNNSYRVVEDFVFTTDGVPSEAFKTYHQSILDKARIALDLQPVFERYFSGVGLALHPSEVGKLHKEFSKFLQSVAKKYGQDKGSEVYQLHLSFFRMSGGN